MSNLARPVNTLPDAMDLTSLFRRAIAPALLALLISAVPASAGLILPEAGPSQNAQDTKTLYTIILEWRYGYTVGKYLNGLRIVRESGARISFGQSVVRQLPVFLQVGWVDAMFVIFTDRRQRAFELLSKTRCVAAEESTSQQAAFASEH